MKIEIEKEVFKIFFEKTDSVGVIYPFLLCFKDKSILSADDEMTIRRRDDTFSFRLKWGREELWEDIRSKKKSTEEGTNKDIDESEALKRKALVDKSFIIGEQSINFYSSVDLVDLIDT